MRKLFLILALVFVSCDNDTIIEEPDCGCVKNIYVIEKTSFWQGDVLNIVYNKVLLYKENVECQDESSGNIGTTHTYEIKCN